MLDKKGRGEDFKKNRSKNHARQYYTLYKSWPIVKKLNPDILIRIREDALVQKPLDISKFIGRARRPGSDCRACRELLEWY